MDNLSTSALLGGRNILSGFLEISILTVVISYFFIVLSSSKKTNHLKAFPGPRALPIVGTGYMMLFKPTEVYKWSWNLCRKWGGEAVITWKLRLPVLWVSSADITSQLLSNPNFVAKAVDINIFWRQPGGNGLSSSPAHIHNTRRKLLFPGYTRYVIENSIPIFSQETLKILTPLKKFAISGEVFDVVDILMSCSFYIICRAAFGDLAIYSSTEEAHYQVHCFHAISQNFTRRIMSPKLWLRNDFVYFNLTEEGRYTKKCMDSINRFGQRGIDLRRKTWMKMNNDDKRYSCYLDLLLDLVDKNALDESEVLGELNNYIVAGHDTTALTVAWCLFALALNDISFQDKICAELEEIFPGKTTSEWTIDISKIKQMKYLELCVKEALRLFPTSPILPRSTTTDIQLKDGRVIPAGTDVFIMVDMIHRDPKCWEDPEKFIPERHLKSNPAFLPFASGARNCIGQAFAMNQVKVELALLIKEFVWETVDKEESLQRLFQGLMVPADGIRFKIQPRSRKHKTISNVL